MYLHFSSGIISQEISSETNLEWSHLMIGMACPTQLGSSPLIDTVKRISDLDIVLYPRKGDFVLFDH